MSELDAAFAGHDLTMQKLTDVSVGTFRISQDYMKKLRRALPTASAVQFPYVNVGGVYQYPPRLLKEMEEYLIEELAKRIDKEKIYHE